MLILGIESSCDETAAAVVENGRRVLSNIIASQIDLHAPTGGVVPEVAAREHAVKIIPVIDRALKEARVSARRIDALAVTCCPGLISCLLVGVNAGKTLSFLWKKPLIPVHHIHGHLYAPWLSHNEAVQFPVVSLSVSGGHNELVLISDYQRFRVLGATLDDAAGEAYDKVARLLGLSYPGGPALSKLAEKGDPFYYQLPRVFMEKYKNPKNWRNLDFSFSGLKTATLRLLQKEGNRIRVSDLAASFQHAVNEVLSTKLLNAAMKYGACEIHLTGGVSANQDLRKKIETALRDRFSPTLGELTLSPKVRFRFPVDLKYCTDNAAMIAGAGYFQYRKAPSKYVNWRRVQADAQFRL